MYRNYLLVFLPLIILARLDAPKPERVGIIFLGPLTVLVNQGRRMSPIALTMDHAPTLAVTLEVLESLKEAPASTNKWTCSKMARATTGS